MQVFKNIYNSLNVVHFLYFILIAFSSLLLLSPIEQNSVGVHFFNSDTLYLPSIYLDVFQNGNQLSDWTLNPAPNFFPDMLVYFLLMLIFNGNFLLASYSFAVIQLFAIGILLSLILKRLSPESFYLAKFSFGLLFLFFLPGLFNDDFLFSFFILTNSYHLGSFVLTLFSIILTYDFISKGKAWKLVLLFLISIFAIVSDKSYIYNFSAPLFLIASFSFFKTRKNNTLWILISILSSVCISYLILDINKELHWFLIPETELSIDLLKIFESLNLFLKQTLKYLLELSWVSLIIILSILSYLLQFVNFILSKEYTKKHYQLVGFVISTSIIFTPVVLAKYTGVEHIRYNYHSLILLIFFLPYNLSIWKDSYRKIVDNRGVVWLSLGFYFSLLTLAIVLSPNRRHVGNYFNFYPDRVKVIEEIGSIHNLKAGLATYWDAKYISMFSKNKLQVYCVFENLVPYRHVVNSKWYTHSSTNNNRPKIFNYFIVRDELMLNNIKQIFKEIKIINTNYYDLVMTEDFYLDQVTFQIVKIQY